jgi:site-specific DNA recombinase
MHYVDKPTPTQPEGQDWTRNGGRTWKRFDSHARKNGVRYRYYTSLALLQGRPEQAGSVNRVPATDIEGAVADAVRAHLKLDAKVSQADAIKTHVERVEVRQQQLIVVLRDLDGSKKRAKKHATIEVPWTKPPSKKRREILLPASPPTEERMRPIRADARARLVTAIARGRRWLDEVVTSGTTAEQIAARERCSARKVNMTISLAFLAPELVKAAIEGRLPRGIGMTRLSDLPAEWTLQRQALGLAAS